MSEDHSVAKKKECTTYLLNKLLAFVIQQSGIGGVHGGLLFGPVGDRFDGECGMLGFMRWYVLALFEAFRHIPWHGEIYLAFGVVPVKMYADVSVAGPIGAEGVIRFKHSF